MTAKCMLVSPRNILTYYHDEIRDKERARRIVEAENRKKNRIITIVAEEIGFGKYQLIEKFEYYSALLQTEPDKSVPCLVYPRNKEKERLLHILKVSIPLEKGTSWLFKNTHVMKLIYEHQMTVKEIARKINFKESQINSYVLDNRIPLHIRKRVNEKDAKTVVEKICSSRVIPVEMKGILYEKAILDRGSDYRLTTEKFGYMKVLCSSCEFPSYLLKNTQLLEGFINDLLYTNFEMADHMTSLLASYLSIDYQISLPYLNQINFLQ